MSTRPPITCHILDTTCGKPASNVVCSIYKVDVKDEQDVITVDEPEPFALARTNEDGRVPQWIFNPDPKKRDKLALLGIEENETGLRWSVLMPGVYKIRFQTGKYFSKQGHSSFFPFVEIVFNVEDGSQHYHIPLLLSNYGYTTYRGS